MSGSFAHAVYHLVGDLDLSAFDTHYRNDKAGAPGHAPAMLARGEDYDPHAWLKHPMVQRAQQEKRTKRAAPRCLTPFIAGANTVDNASDHPEESLTNYATPSHAAVDPHGMGDTDE